MEAAELAIFMIAACVVVVALEHPSSPWAMSGVDAFGRRVLSGVAMGMTAVAIIYSPWGKQSGAHFNPAVTLTYWHLGRMPGSDAVFYILAQHIGAVAGVLLSRLVLGDAVAHPAVCYGATEPGAAGPFAAFAAELAISFGLMGCVLWLTSTPHLASSTGLFCGLIVAVYIIIEAPLSGMSMNPARSFGPALVGGRWHDLWIYFTAPPLGMLLAAEVHISARVRKGACAKLHHDNPWRCIFCPAT